MGVWQPKGFNMAARVTPAALCCECQDIDRMKPEIFLVFHYFAVGLRRPFSLGGCRPRSTPRRSATLKICGSDASSLLVFGAVLLARQLDQFALFFIGQPPLVRFFSSPSVRARLGGGWLRIGRACLVVFQPTEQLKPE
jgi:hypothetical protein